VLKKNGAEYLCVRFMVSVSVIVRVRVTGYRLRACPIEIEIC